MTVIDGAAVQSVPYEAQNVEEDTVVATAHAATSTVTMTDDLESLTSSAVVADARTAKTSTHLSDKFVEALTSVVVALVGLITTIFARTKEVKGKSEKTDAPVAKKEDATSSSSSKSSSGSTPTSSSGDPTSSSSSGTSKTTTTPATSAGAKETSSTKGTPTHLSAIRDDSGVVTVRTLDGFIVKAEAKQNGWTITDLEGKTTRIYGDPHVKESDGDAWDFKARGTFVFGKNKITVETRPLSNGTTVTRQITIYSGNERVTIGGIDKNQPTIVAVANDGKQHDDSLSDGTIYRRGGTSKGENWSATVNGKKVVMGGKR